MAGWLEELGERDIPVEEIQTRVMEPLASFHSAPPA
jgi:hypothetical protein